MVSLYARGARLLLLVATVSSSALGKSVTPHFKWGQTKEQLFISVMVRDLSPDSVSVQLSDDGDLSFRAATRAGEAQVLDLPLREDVSKETLSWEIAARQDKWGVATLITIGKQHPHRWDLLVNDPKKFKGLIDKDWTRQDQSLEPAEEATTLDDAEEVLKLDEKTFNKSVSKHPCMVVAARFPWCSDCKTSDAVFAKAASLAKARGKKKQTQDWKKVTFAYVDARSNKKLGRRLGTACTYQCEYLVFSGSADEAPAKLKTQYEEAKLLDDVAKFLRPAVVEVKMAEEAAALKASNVTAMGHFESQDQKEYLVYKSVANRMRGEVVFAARFGEARDSIELTSPSFSEVLSLKTREFLASPTVLEMWLRRRSVPVLQDYDWQLRDTYEKLEVPIARLWYDDKTGDADLFAKVNDTVTSVAKKMYGRMAFVRQKSSTYSYELRDYGLSHPEEYPSFGIAANTSWSSPKYGLNFASSAKDFWNDPASEAKLLEFCEGVLAGEVEESHESGPVHANWTKGEVKRIVWKSFSELKHPKTDLLLEIHGKYRDQHEAKLKETENLAKVLEPWAEKLTVASYDTSESYLPATDFPRDKYASHTDWYWVPASGEPPVKLAKPKKDPPMKKVLQFLRAQAPELEISVDHLLEKWEEAMKANPAPSQPQLDAPMGDEVDAAPPTEGSAEKVRLEF